MSTFIIVIIIFTFNFHGNVTVYSFPAIPAATLPPVLEQLTIAIVVTFARATLYKKGWILFQKVTEYYGVVIIANDF